MKFEKFRISPIVLAALALMAAACSGEHVHSWDEGQTIVEKTCESNGWIIYSCFCGEQKSEKIESTGCEDDGTGKCVYCGQPLETNDGASNSGRSTPPVIPTHGSVVDYAASRVGCPFVWGAAGPDTFDSAGLVVWCYGKIGVSLPHYTEALYNMAKKRVPVSQARPGDVLYRSGHVAISTGGPRGIEAPHPGACVCHTSSDKWECALMF